MSREQDLENVLRRILGDEERDVYLQPAQYSLVKEARALLEEYPDVIDTHGEAYREPISESVQNTGKVTAEHLRWAHGEGVAIPDFPLSGARAAVSRDDPPYAESPAAGAAGAAGVIPAAASAAFWSAAAFAAAAAATFFAAASSSAFFNLIWAVSISAGVIVAKL